MKDPALSTMFSLRFQFSTPFVEPVERGINHEVEDVLYNYIDCDLNDHIPNWIGFQGDEGVPFDHFVSSYRCLFPTKFCSCGL